MPLLQVKGCPEDVYDRLGQVAQAENRSITQQTIVLLRQALDLPESNKTRRQRVLVEASQLRAAMPSGLPDPTQLIREDRDR